MFKDFSFDSIPVILKYIVLIFLISAAYFYYFIKVNQISSEAKSVEIENLQIAAAQRRLAGEQAQRLFQIAKQAQHSGDLETAKSQLVKLIAEYPELPEPYINLASLQASIGQLTEARVTLLKGLKANKNYAVLFQNFQKIQGALAANAYRTALADRAETITRMDLPVSENIDLSQGLRKTNSEPHEAEHEPSN